MFKKILDIWQNLGRIRWGLNTRETTLFQLFAIIPGHGLKSGVEIHKLPLIIQQQYCIGSRIKQLSLELQLNLLLLQRVVDLPKFTHLLQEYMGKCTKKQDQQAADPGLNINCPQPGRNNLGVIIGNY